MALKNLTRTLTRAIASITTDIPRHIGVTAVNHFSKNFDTESFRGKKWKEVKRRDSSSSWYGYQYGANSKRPSSHPRRSSRGKYTHYSPTATRTPILSSQDNNLANSLEYKTNGKQVHIISDLPYAQIHNQGGQTKVFGKHHAQMPKRMFVGHDPVFLSEVDNVITTQLNRIFK